MNKHLITKSPCIIATVLMLGIWSIPSYAYLDPGTGSMLIQGIIGAIAALSVTIKLYWHKIKSMFSDHNGEDSSAEDTTRNP